MIVLGASPKEDKYSYQAVKLLQEKGYDPLPVHPAAKEVAGVKAYPSLAEAKNSTNENIDTISIYVNADISSKATEELLKVKPLRIIFNPGAENPLLEDIAAKAGIETKEACTLVMLRTGQF